MKHLLKKIISTFSPAYRRIGLLEARVNDLGKKIDELDFQIKSEMDQLWMRTSWLISDAPGTTKIKRNPELVVSLTTTPERVHTVHLTIESIFQQSEQPDKVILWLDDDNFDEKSIPSTLRKMQARGLDIRFCEDVKSYKKLIFTYEQCPEANIVTADDDLVYPNRWLEKLYKHHLKNPSCVVCHRAHWITLDNDGAILPYPKWDREIELTEPSYNVFPTGSGGVLYPPGSINELITDKEQFFQFAPSNDDFWFKAMTMLNGRKSSCIGSGMMADNAVVEIRGTQESALWVQNVANDRNSGYEAVFPHFDLVKMFER